MQITTYQSNEVISTRRVIFKLQSPLETLIFILIGTVASDEGSSYVSISKDIAFMFVTLQIFTVLK